MKKLLCLLFLLPVMLVAATGSVMGTVTVKSSGEGFPGASVFLKDTEYGTTTRKNGSFTMRGIPVGRYTLIVSFMGYERQEEKIVVRPSESVSKDFALEPKAIELSGMTVSATRAVERETPIAFTNIDEKKINDKYTTEDMPSLLDNVPGVFSTSGGLGESEMYIRGFDADKVQVLINGIPVNDPESQQVYWSNWTGLSSNVKSVQVQRGAGSSLYGSGAFGGSVNIETIDVKPKYEFTWRTSAGIYEADGQTADGKGGMEDYQPVNYTTSLRFNSGLLFDSSFSYSLSAERKGGHSYLNGTKYDGWSFGAETQFATDEQKVNVSFIGAPQEHNQARKAMDMDLMGRLGRQYNRNNHDWQENYYFKPQVSIRHEWNPSKDDQLLTNYFFTMGEGGGKYMKNDVFDVETGENRPLDVNENWTNNDVASHALWAYNTTRYSNNPVVMDGFNPSDPDLGGAPSFNGKAISGSGTNMVNTFDHTWMNDSHNNHTQFGINTYFKHKMNNWMELVLGGETRLWLADHYAEAKQFRYYDGSAEDNVGIYPEVQRRYDYSSQVINFSGFLRTKLKPVKDLNIMLDGQYAMYTSEVDENPINFFDFQTGSFLSETYYNTKGTMVYDDSTGTWHKKYSDSDYDKTYRFFSPKFGINYNLSKEFNIMFNSSIAYKEPRVSDWYSYTDGPDSGQSYSYQSEGGVSYNGYAELKPEKTTTFEGGMGYHTPFFSANVNYYVTDYTDKIESVKDERGSLTINAGKARHQGIEITSAVNWDEWDANTSMTFAQNRWEKMNVETIFGLSADQVEGKVVPYSPEKMISGELGYTIDEIVGENSLRLGLKGNWWDNYWGSYSNTYKVIDYDNPDMQGNYTNLKTVSSKLPEYFEMGASLKYSFKINQKDATFRLDFNNLTNHNNYSAAYYTSDYGRNDNLNGERYMYVMPAPGFNVFATTEFKF